MAAKKSSNNSSKNIKKIQKKLKGKGLRYTVCLIIIAALSVGVAYSMDYQDKIDEAFGLRKVETYQKGDLVTLGSLNIHFVDVGQGDACIIELPDNRTMLIDAGENKTSVKDKMRDYIKQVNNDRKSFSRPQIKYFDYVIATHSDSDHIGSLAYVLGLYPAATFYRPNEQVTYSGYSDPALTGANARNKFWDENGEKDTKTYKEAIEAGYKNHDNFVEAIVTNPYDNTQNIIKPDVGNTDESYYEINFYGPIQSSYSDHNNYSPILIVEYKNRRIALSGDCEALGESGFASAVTNATGDSRYYALKSAGFYADIIKLGHHGSRTSSSEAYLDIMTKSQYIGQIYAVISCGEGNSYKHPHTEVLQRLEKYKFDDDKILRTDKVGSIFFALNFYEGLDNAFVEQDSAGVLTEITYPVEVAGITIRYSVIAPIAVVIIGLILLAIASLGGKKNDKKTGANSGKNSKSGYQK